MPWCRSRKSALSPPPVLSLSLSLSRSLSLLLWLCTSLLKFPLCFADEGIMRREMESGGPGLRKSPPVGRKIRNGFEIMERVGLAGVGEGSVVLARLVARRHPLHRVEVVRQCYLLSHPPHPFSPPHSLSFAHTRVYSRARTHTHNRTIPYTRLDSLQPPPHSLALSFRLTVTLPYPRSRSLIFRTVLRFSHRQVARVRVECSSDVGLREGPRQVVPGQPIQHL